MALRGWLSPSLVLPFRLPRLAGLWIAGPLVGGALLPSLADPAKIRVSTYCEKRARSGIITGEMKHTHTQEEIAYNRALAVFEKMVWAEKGSALRASLEARFATLHAEWLATVKNGGAL